MLTYSPYARSLYSQSFLAGLSDGALDGLRTKVATQYTDMTRVNQKDEEMELLKEMERPKELTPAEQGKADDLYLTLRYLRAEIDRRKAIR